MQKIIIILIIFVIDRLSKIYLIDIQESGNNVDFYIFSFLNIFLVWNTGVGFGLASMEANVYYHILTFIITIINLILIYIIFKVKNYQGYLIAMVLGGSTGNLFDRLYYFAVPDFIDFHIGNFHWFTFNGADIFITIGILGLILIEMFDNKRKKSIDAQ